MVQYFVRFLPLWALLIFGLAPQPAKADLKICNKTSSLVGLAIGYKKPDNWVTEGWWNIAKGNCRIILKGPLIARFYYFHAIDYDSGGEWSGPVYMCTQNKSFTIQGIHNCFVRGYDRANFFEINTYDQKDWVINLAAPQSKLPQPP